MMRKSWYIITILGIGFLMSMFVHWQSKRGLQSELNSYISHSSQETDLTVTRISVKFDEIYNAMHTIARLPGVRAIDRTKLTQDMMKHPESLMDIRSQITVQEIFNTLISNVSVNELYIVPINFDPDNLDPKQTAPRKPLFTYKYFIPPDDAATISTFLNTPDEDENEEREIDEYRLLRAQLDWLQENYPSTDQLDGFNYPMLSGSEVVTCHIAPSILNEEGEENQAGFILSLPYYDLDGKLAGCISSIVPTNTLENLLHNGNFVILNTRYDYIASAQAVGQWQLSQEYTNNDTPDDQLLYSVIRSIPTPDQLGEWHLWVGYPDTMFWSRSGVITVLKARTLGYFFVFILTIGGLISTKLLHHAHIRLSKVNAGLEKLATIDQLTGLPNRTYFLKRLGHIIKQSNRDTSNRFALIFFDLDHFKLVNDTLGHKVGDALLCQIANLTRKELRDTDLVGRFGGDEFLVLLNNLNNWADAKRKADRLLEVLSTPHMIENKSIICPPSIGLVTNECNYKTPDEMIRDADIAMYRAKESGRAKVVTFNKAMHIENLDHLSLEVDLRSALTNDQFRLVFQPIVELEHGSLIGFESLIRWDHPEFGQINPLDFIPIAEEIGLIAPIGKWVLRTAAAQITKWNHNLLSDDKLKMFINVSKRQLLDTDFLSTLEECKHDFKMQEGEFILEITETAIVEDLDLVVPILDKIKKYGYHIAIDDFGTGVSSFSALHKLPIDILKIDQSFLETIDQDESLLIIVSSITTLAKQLGIRTVAEGIETSDHAVLMQSIGCTFGQGYFFTKPLSQTDAEAYIHARIHTQLKHAA